MTDILLRYLGGSTSWLQTSSTSLETTPRAIHCSTIWFSGEALALELIGFKINRPELDGLIFLPAPLFNTHMNFLQVGRLFPSAGR